MDHNVRSLGGLSLKDRKRKIKKKRVFPASARENSFIVGKEGLVSLDSAPLFD